MVARFLFIYAELIATVREFGLDKLRVDQSLCSDLFSNKGTLNIKRGKKAQQLEMLLFLHWEKSNILYFYWYLY